jgi:hypothetical protein
MGEIFPFPENCSKREKVKCLKRKSEKAGMGKTVIGVMAADRGLGATHLSIALANFMAEQWGFRTACVERSSYPAWKNLYEDVYSRKWDAEQPYFDFNRVTYFPCVQPKQMADVLDTGYTCYVLDLGSDFKENREEFIRADKMVLIGSCSRWRRAQWERFLREHMEKEKMDSWKLTVRECSESDKRKWEKTHLPEILACPLIADPFHPDERVYSFLNELI